MTTTVEFWFDFASTYSHLSAHRIADAAQARDVPVVWRPFLLGPIFQAQGWHTSPFAIYPTKGRYMWRDVSRRAAQYDVAFKPPWRSDPRAFPQNSVLAARVAFVGLDEGWGEAFSRAVFHAQFAEGADIADLDTVRALIAKAGGEPDPALAAATAPANKQRLRAAVETAHEAGIFGAPTFIVDAELFWGDDRLEDALDWAADHKPMRPTPSR